MRAQFRSMVWHDQFKTAVLANAATGDWPPGCLPNNPPLQQSITPFFAGGVVEIDFNLANSEGVNIYPESFRGRDGDADFKFLARDTSPTYVDKRPLLVAGKPEIREYKAVLVVGDIEVSQFSDEITVNCARLV